MKRSTTVFLGAMGLVSVAWVVERAMTPPLPTCPIGQDGKPIITPGCRVSSSSSSSGYVGGSRTGQSAMNSKSSSGSGSVLPVTSTGGWGSFGRSFSSGS